MIGISSSGKEQISAIVEEMFDTIALQFIGDIPKLKNAKKLVISSKRNFGLPHLFVQSMQNKIPNQLEADVLKSLLNSAYGYIDSLKSKTSSNVAEIIDGLAKEAKLNGTKLNEEVVRKVIMDEMEKAKNHLKTIAEAESTKLRNIGSAMQISRVASDLQDSDPTVFFIISRTKETCSECIRLHLMPDGVTPRLWKFKDLKQGYGKRGDPTPSAWSRHPNCKCTLTYLSRGFSFDDKGLVSYKEESHDEYSRQQEFLNSQK